MTASVKSMAIRKEHVSFGRGEHRIDLFATITPDGLVATIVGGKRPHVGAVAVGIPRPSLAEPSRLSVTSSVLTLIGHKDDEVARPIAEKLAKGLNKTSVVVAGMHIEGADREDIKTLKSNSVQAARIFLNKMEMPAT